MPNLNAALLVAQMENLEKFLANKRELAKKYASFFSSYTDIKFIKEPKNTSSNYWLQAVILENLEERNQFLNFMNKNGIMTRPIWKLINELAMFKNSECSNLDNAKFLEQRIVNISSGVRI